MTRRVPGQVFQQLARLVRGSNWWLYKIPPLLAMGYAVLLLQAPPPGKAFGGLLGVLMSLFSVAAFGYVVNDIFDIEEDRRAGKPNVMARLAGGQRFGLCTLFAGLGFAPWLLVDFGPAAALILALNYALPLAYSIPPVRLKERDAWGVVADASGVHAVPTLFVVAALTNLAATSREMGLRLAITATTWALLVGLRGILIHQLWDHERDSRAGVRTMVATRDPKRVRRFVRWGMFPAEMLAFSALIWALYPFSPVILYTAVGYAVFDLLRHRTWSWTFDPAPATPGTYIPPAEFYEVWLPLALAGTLATRSPLFWLVPALHSVLFFKGVQMRAREVVALLSSTLGLHTLQKGA